MVVHFNVTVQPTAAWTAQQITEAFPEDKAPRFLIRDRDGIYGNAFQQRVRNMGIEEVPTSPRSPWQNAYAERFVRSIKSECLDRIIFFSGKHLQCVVNQYLEHYHAERNHQGIGNRLIETTTLASQDDGPIVSRSRVGGLLKYYFRSAA